MVFISSITRSLINLFTLIGLFVGFIFLGRQRSFILSSLFFLSPLYSLSPKIFRVVNKNFKELDYGWLEISFNIEKITKSVSKHIHMFNWPNFLAFNRIS